MQRLTRLALTFVLAVALPLQGMAAATMVSCGLGPHDHAPTHARSHDHHAAEMADHGHSHSADARSNETQQGKSDLAKGTLHKCSVCASCCASAAVPSQAVAFETVKLTDHFAPLATRGVPAYVSEGLERPPRELFA